MAKRFAKFRLRIKHFFQLPRSIAIISWLGAQYLRFVYFTSSWNFINEYAIKDYHINKRPVILCFWHNRLAMLAFSWRFPHTLFMAISSHPDGQIIAKIVNYFGVQTMHGSTSQGGSKLARGLLRALKNGHTVGITPDGPRGPRFSIQSGIVDIARLGKADIVPLAYSVKRRIILNSWDRLIFPLPFNHGVFAWGEPITVDDLLSSECADALIKENINKLTNQCDAQFGHVPINEGEPKSKRINK